LEFTVAKVAITAFDGVRWGVLATYVLGRDQGDSLRPH
jgi:hypothetical protein